MEWLPANSKQLLDEIVCADNPTEMLSERFAHTSNKEDNELRGIIQELREKGYVDVIWADDLPYLVTINNSARTYNEYFSHHKTLYEMQGTAEGEKMKPIIFISHRSTDKKIADMILDFLAGTAIPKENVFCSSLPGNDINEKISGEVKCALKDSSVNITILSQDYYQSAYCLNEAGVIWFHDDIPVIPIALPEINSGNMYGFLNSEYKLRRLDCDTDISYIYDTVRAAVSAQQSKVSIITHEAQKIKERYNQYLQTRENSKLAAPMTSCKR